MERPKPVLQPISTVRDTNGQHGVPTTAQHSTTQHNTYIHDDVCVTATAKEQMQSAQINGWRYY